MSIGIESGRSGALGRGLCLGAFIALSACADGASQVPPGAAGDSAVEAARVNDDGSTGNWPPIHLDQVQERLEDGENAARRDYAAALARCRQTGWPVRELTQAQLEKLGTQRVRMWISPSIEVLRHEQWQLAMDEGAPVESCLFRLRHDGNYSYADGNRGMSRALGDAAGPDARASAQGDVDGNGDGDGDILPRFALEPSVAPPGFSDLGQSQVAGQPCQAWRGTGPEPIQQCIWSGGRAFGFDDHAPGDACSPARPIAATLEEIVLSQDPVEGTGCRIRTSAFTVGAALDPGAYQAPAGGDGA